MRRFKNYVFDLDATLYLDHGEIEADCERLIDKFFIERLHMSLVEAREQRREILRRFHYEAEAVDVLFGVSVEEFMDYICNIDVSHLTPDPALENLLVRLPGRRLVYTDSTIRHVRDTLCQIGVNIGVFANVFDAAMAGYKFKYQREAFKCFFKECGVDPRDSVMFEDSLRNLKTAKSYGMTTVLISAEPKKEDFIDYWFPDIKKALEAML